MQGLSAEDPADLVVAWEAVEELLAAVPEGSAKDVLRMVAAGLPADDIAERLDLAVPDVEALVARGRIRVLTAAVASHEAGPHSVRMAQWRVTPDVVVEVHHAVAEARSSSMALSASAAAVTWTSAANERSATQDDQQ